MRDKSCPETSTCQQRVVPRESNSKDPKLGRTKSGVSFGVWNFVYRVSAAKSGGSTLAPARLFFDLTVLPEWPFPEPFSMRVSWGSWPPTFSMFELANRHHSRAMVWLFKQVQLKTCPTDLPKQTAESIARITVCCYCPWLFAYKKDLIVVGDSDAVKEGE